MKTSPDGDLIAHQPEFVQRLIAEPLAGPKDLGAALPATPHATSVCLPTWQDVVDYEEGAARVRDRLRAGYPRFVFNPLVAEAAAKIGARLGVSAARVLLYPSRPAAERAGRAIEAWGGGACKVQAIDAFTVALVHDAPELAKAVWQHAGEGISSRHAASLLGPDDTANSTRRAEQDAAIIRQRVAEWVGVPEDHVFLFGTGMAAIYALFRAAVDRPEAAGLPTVQFGFPYVDALKLQEKLRFRDEADQGGAASPRSAQRNDCLFYPTADIDALNRDLHNDGKAAALFCEFPSNPLLACPDLTVLRGLADLMGFPVFVDDTVACCLNTNLLPFADAITMSLTKYFVGAGDATGGAVAVKPGGRFAQMLLTALQAGDDGSPHPADLAVLAERSEDMPERINQINRSTRAVVSYLRGHPKVKRVYYPDGYEAGWRQQDACGGLLSIDLVDAEVNAPRFYDTLDICKGPNLGTSFSLCGAYTLLAHYHELDFVESCGVSPHLIRLSIGLEPEQELIGRLNRALAVCD